MQQMSTGDTIFTLISQTKFATFRNIHTFRFWNNRKKISKPKKKNSHTKKDDIENEETIKIKEKLKRDYEIDAFDIEFKDTFLGKGASSVVKQGVWLGTTNVAIKIFHNILSDKVENAELTHFYNEVALLSQLRHPNIVSMYGITKKDGYICLITGFVKGWKNNLNLRFFFLFFSFNNLKFIIFFNDFLQYFFFHNFFWSFFRFSFVDFFFRLLFYFFLCVKKTFANLRFFFTIFFFLS